MKHLLFLCCMMMISVSLWAENLSPRTANYVMQVHLDTVEKRLTASTELEWTNPSDDVITELQFHLYYNAFKNSQSTFLQEQDGFDDVLGDYENDPKHWGWTEILSFNDSNGNNLSSSMRYIQPDDDNENDQTVLSIKLKDPIGPGETALFSYKWHAQIPKIRPRTGWNKDFYFFVQWYPKLGVYESAGTRYSEVGGWNCHQYHSSGEYYGEFGNHTVSLKVPKNMIVAASGELLEKKDIANETEWTFHIEDMIDFGWAASKNFKVVNSKWRDTDISFYTYPSKIHMAEPYFKAIHFTLDYLAEHLEEYPFSTLSLVDPPVHGIYTGGMEYSAFISTISLDFIPNSIKISETLVIHELIHQYFQQIISTHEQEEPWMDEGFTTYWETRILDHYYGEKTSAVDIFGIKIGSSEYNRYEHLTSSNPKIAEGYRKARDYKHGGYGTIAYNKTAMWLKTLEGLIGLEVMNEIMRTYYQRWKFRHPCGTDFIDIVNEVVKRHHGDSFGKDMNWFFSQVLYGSDACDYSVASINNIAQSKDMGYLKTLDEFVPSTDIVESEKLYTSEVVLNRLGELKFPVDVRVNFSDGSSENLYWDGQERSTSFSFDNGLKMISAEVDPERKINLDINFLNNSYSVEAEESGIKKLFYQFFQSVQMVMEALSLLF